MDDGASAASVALRLGWVLSNRGPMDAGEPLLSAAPVDEVWPRHGSREFENYLKSRIFLCYRPHWFDHAPVGAGSDATAVAEAGQDLPGAVRKGQIP